jgi:hypothetical protein
VIVLQYSGIAEIRVISGHSDLAETSGFRPDRYSTRKSLVLLDFWKMFVASASFVRTAGRTAETVRHAAI